MNIKTWLSPLSGSLVATLALTSIANAGALSCNQILLKGQAEKSDTFKYADNIDDVRIISKKQYVDTARALILSIENYYGPLTLKKQTVGLDWEAKKNQLFGKIGKTQSPKEFLYLISEFLFSLNDAHVSIELPSSLTWRLPMQFSYSISEGKYFLNYFEQLKLEKQLRKGYLPQLGAELLKINGVSVEEFRSKLFAFRSDGNEITSRSMFAKQLSSLGESRGLPLSNMGDGVWTFTLKTTDSQGHEKIEDVSLEYIKDGVGIIDLATVLSKDPDALLNQFKSDQRSPKEKRGTRPGSAREDIIQRVHRLLNAKALVDDKSTSSTSDEPKFEHGQKYRIGDLKPDFKLPADFEQIRPPFPFDRLLNGKSIFAGTFKRDGKTVGLLRIPSYEPENIDRMPLTLRFYISELQKKSDYLIFDQQSNPGGYVIYSDYVVRAFTGKYDMSKHLHFRVKPTDSFMRQYADLVSELNKIIESLPASTPVMTIEALNRLMAEIRGNFETIHKAYVAGDALSEPISMLAITKFLSLQEAMPTPTERSFYEAFEKATGISALAPQVYTKPVFMLINEFDFSGGDATPASLKDYGRVTLIGTRTAGAGGTVEGFKARLLQAEFEYRLTTSLMYRVGNPQQRYVENYGVQPDLRLDITKEDYLDGQQNVLNKVLELINAQASKN